MVDKENWYMNEACEGWSLEKTLTKYPLLQIWWWISKGPYEKNEVTNSIWAPDTVEFTLPTEYLIWFDAENFASEMLMWLMYKYP